MGHIVGTILGILLIAFIIALLAPVIWGDMIERAKKIKEARKGWEKK